MKRYPKITIVTPNFNQEKFIEQTIKSVLDQNYPNLEYIIIDGGSSDRSIEIIKKYEEQLHFWISEEDSGMYDALNKGFEKGNGDIMGWINSDDILLKDSLNNLAKIFNSNPHISWIRGFPTVIDEENEVIWTGMDLPMHSKYFFYLHRNVATFSFLQQESTFWRRSLWDRAGGKLYTKYKLAADFDLWLRFFKYSELYLTTQNLGAFRKRSGQKSENQNLYLEETFEAIKINQTKLICSQRATIIIWKVFRKIMFTFNSKEIKQKYYSIFDKFLGKGNWIH